MRFRTFVTSILAAAPALPALLPAQGTTGPAVLYGAPGDHELATVAQGTVLDAGQTSGEYVRVTLKGYVATSLLGGKRDSFPVSIQASGARMRADPSTSAAVVAELQNGMGLHVVKRAGTWTQVERAGWVRRSAFPANFAQRSVQKPSAPKRPEATAPVSAPPAQSKAAPPPAAAAPQAGDTTVPSGMLTPAKSAELSPAPGVPGVATLRSGAALTPEARDRGWVRVSVDGWVRESDLVAADSTVSTLSAADLRASPDQYVGKVVRWTVTALAFQTADALRKDMRTDEPYLLARGPGTESALLYLALPPRLVDRAKTLRPMTQVVVMARVRTGRSDPSGVPILDVQSLTSR